MPSNTQVSVDQLASLIGTLGAPVIVDACIDEDFNADPRLIPSSFRHPFRETHHLIPRVGGRDVIVICQKGRKISEGVAAQLRAHGISARNLEGGIFAWRDAGEPLIPAEQLPDRDVDGRTRWVTSQRPGMDILATTWLIRRFIDPQAAFYFVAGSEVELVAEKFDATPLSDDGSAFAAMLNRFALETDALLRLAKIVCVADTEGPFPQTSGLLAILDGLSQIHHDDLSQMEVALPVYDGLYRWAQNNTAAIAQGEETTI